MSLTVLNLNGGGIGMILRNLMVHWHNQNTSVEVALLAQEAADLEDLAATYPALHVAYTPRKAGESRLKAFFLLVRDVWVWLKANPRDAYFIWGKELLAVVVLCLFILRRSPKLAMGCNTHTTQHLASKPIWLRVPFKWVYKLMFKRVAAFTAQANAMKEDLVQNYGVPAQKITVIPPLITPVYYDAPLPAKRAEAPTLLFVGRLAPEKNIPQLLRAFAQLHKTMPAAKLVIVGPGTQAPYATLATQLNVAQAVTFAGPQKDLLAYFQTAHGLVLCSSYEGFSMVLAEALACGTPVVSYNCPSGPAEIIEEGENGYLIPQGHEAALAEGMHKVLSKTWDAAKLRASVQRYHPTAVAQSYTQVLTALEF